MSNGFWNMALRVVGGWRSKPPRKLAVVLDHQAEQQTRNNSASKKQLKPVHGHAPSQIEGQAVKQGDAEIVRTLANDAGVLSVSQIARTWWSDTPWGRTRAKNRLEALELDH